METPKSDLYILIRAIVRVILGSAVLVLVLFLLHAIPIAAENAIINHFF